MTKWFRQCAAYYSTIIAEGGNHQMVALRSSYPSDPSIQLLRSLVLYIRVSSSFCFVYVLDSCFDVCSLTV